MSTTGAPGGRFLDNVKVHLVSNVDEAMAFKRWLGERHENGLVGFDIESTGLDPRDPGAAIRMAQFGDTVHGWAIPWLDWRGLCLEALNAWEGEWGIHNLAFESKWLRVHGGYQFPRERTIDTMLGAHVINPLGSGALKTLAAQQVDGRAGAGQNRLAEAFKANGWGWDTVPVDFPDYWMYAALDPVITAGLWGKQRPQLRGEYKDVFDLEMNVRFIISRMEWNGSRVDLGYAQEKLQLLTDHAQAVDSWGKRALKIKLSSPVQVGRWLKEQGVEFLNYTATGQPQVDKALLKLLANPDNGYATDIQTVATQTLSMRKASKYASTYFQNFLSKNTNGYVHPEIRTLGARTGRMSISSPAMQQCPKDSALVRGAFIPSEGNVLLTCDYSQVEGRILSELAIDPQLQEAFLNADAAGGDFFVEVGKQVYDEPSFRKDDKRRGLIKNFFYGTMYGAGVKKMAETAGIPQDRMQVVADAIDRQFPGIQKFMRDVESVGKEREIKTGQGYVITRIGRRLPCDQNKVYTLTNYVIQSTAADVLKRALVRLDAAGYEEWMILPVHDEVVFDIPADHADQARVEIPGLMAEMDHPVPLLADLDGPFRSNWGEKYL